MLDLAYPRSCASCEGAVGDEGVHICWDCVASFEVIAAPFCSVCGDPVEGVVGHQYTCSGCARGRQYFDLARSAARFRGALKVALHSFKYGRLTCLVGDLVPLLSACVGAHYSTISFDGVTAVPLYPRKERERTYNQAGLLAKGLAARLKLENMSNCLGRVRSTVSQTDLTASARRENVKGAFGVRQPGWVEGRNLLLVDDVMTTGATVGECSRVLKGAGAAGVYVVTVARG